MIKQIVIEELQEHINRGSILNLIDWVGVDTVKHEQLIVESVTGKLDINCLVSFSHFPQHTEGTDGECIGTVGWLKDVEVELVSIYYEDEDCYTFLASELSENLVCELVGVLVRDIKNVVEQQAAEIYSN